MTPRQLRHLRIDDKVTSPHDLTRKLPVETTDLRKWFPFCQDIAARRTWNCELMTIDFEFSEDRTVPPFPVEGMPASEAPPWNDAYLRNLHWPEALVTNVRGPNTGLLIGLHLLSMAHHRDLPCGVGFRTYHPSIVLEDTPSAMIATQIVLATGVPVPIGRVHETVRAVVELIASAPRETIRSVIEATRRFRLEFLRRAGAEPGARSEPVRLWMEPTSLYKLLDVFQSAASEAELDRQLSKYGIEFRNRDGSLDCIDVRSMFMDLLYRDDVHGERDVFRHLTLDHVRAPTRDEEAGPVWQFVERLASHSPANIGPVLQYFRSHRQAGASRFSINKAVRRVEHRFLALICAYLHEYGEQWISAATLSWDPMEDEFNGDFPPMTTQIAAVLKVLDHGAAETREGPPADAADDGYLPLTHAEGPSILDLLRKHCEGGSLLRKPLRYDPADHVRYREQRETALRRMLDIAKRWGCVEEQQSPGGEGTGRYRVISRRVPERRPMRITQRDIGRVLGLSDAPGADPSGELRRIITRIPGFADCGVEEFLAMLEESPLPEHLRLLALEFVDEFWDVGSGCNIPESAWPACLVALSRVNGAPMTPTQARTRALERNRTAARMQSHIAPAELSVQRQGLSVWCRRCPSEEIGGDYYRVRNRAAGGLRIYLTDIRGHGWPAALLVQEIHGIIVTLEKQGLAPDGVCAELNTQLRDEEQNDRGAEFSDEADGRWATFICADLDLASRTLTYANASHPSPLLVHRDGSAEWLDAGRGLAVGMFPGSVYERRTVALSPGDRLVFMTDGLIENGGEKPCITPEALERLVVQHRGESAAEIGRLFMKQVTDSGPRLDDVTLIVVAAAA